MCLKRSHRLSIKTKFETIKGTLKKACLNTPSLTNLIKIEFIGLGQRHKKQKSLSFDKPFYG
jgi:hypothetical protein